MKQEYMGGWTVTLTKVERTPKDCLFLRATSEEHEVELVTTPKKFWVICYLEQHPELGLAEVAKLAKLYWKSETTKRMLS